MIAMMIDIRPPAIRMNSIKPAKPSSARISEGSVAMSQHSLESHFVCSCTMELSARDKDQYVVSIARMVKIPPTTDAGAPADHCHLGDLIGSEQRAAGDDDDNDEVVEQAEKDRPFDLLFIFVQAFHRLRDGEESGHCEHGHSVESKHSVDGTSKQRQSMGSRKEGGDAQRADQAEYDGDGDLLTDADSLQSEKHNGCRDKIDEKRRNNAWYRQKPYNDLFRS